MGSIRKEMRQERRALIPVTTHAFLPCIALGHEVVVKSHIGDAVVVFVTFGCKDRFVAEVTKQVVIARLQHGGRGRQW